MKIRNLALCLIQRDEEILVLEGFDILTKELFYRPLGGGIEFGETAEKAALRELKEEVGAEIKDISYLASFESIFSYNGAPGHEIIFLLSASFKDKSFYLTETIEGKEGGDAFVAKWVGIREFLVGNKTLYPDGLSKYLQRILTNTFILPFQM